MFTPNVGDKVPLEDGHDRLSQKIGKKNTTTYPFGAGIIF
jgi:hypothetical protein